jgi:hypothetical protein
VGGYLGGSARGNSVKQVILRPWLMASAESCPFSMDGIAEQMRAHELVRGSLGAYAKTFAEDSDTPWDSLVFS